MTTENRFNKETTATKPANNTTGFGLNLKLTGDEPEYIGLFINVQKDSIAETLILNDDGSFDLETLSAILGLAPTEKGRVYETGKSLKKEVDKAGLLELLLKK